jgi:hypothetical protein
MVRKLETKWDTILCKGRGWDAKAAETSAMRPTGSSGDLVGFELREDPWWRPRVSEDGQGKIEGSKGFE